MNHSLHLLLAGLLAAFVVGCDRAPADAPPQIKYGHDECAHCGMILTDERCAAAIIVQDANGRTSLLFDDIGDMLDYESAHPDLAITHRFVHDFAVRTWLDATAASYVVSETIHTPMGSGIIAFANASQAQASGAQASAKDYTQLTTARRQKTSSTKPACCANPDAAASAATPSPLPE